MGMMQGFHMERSRYEIKYFYEWLSEEYKWAEHIEEWMEMYGGGQDKYVNRVCIIAPRSHSKSCSLRVKLLHMCLFEKRKNGKPMTVWLFSASNAQAANRLAEIEEDMLRHPELRKLIKKSTKKKLTFNNGAWIRAVGVGSAIRGEHPGVVALDDILAELGDMTMDKVVNWFRMVTTPMTDPGTSLFVVGTPMALTDLYHTEMLSERAKEVWNSNVWSSLPNWDEHRADPNIPLIALWAEFRPVGFLLEQKLSMNDDLAFSQEYLCKVVDDDAQVFKRGDVRKNIDIHAVLGSNVEFDNSKYILGFDPSHGIGKDFTVIIVLRQDEQGFIHFVDMWRRNDFPPDKQADILIEWAGRYGGASVAAEDVGFQSLYDALIRQKGAIVDYRSSKASNKGLKQGLLNRLRTWFEQGKFHWPYGNIATRTKVNMIFDELEGHVWKAGEIVDVGRHNDCVMALAHAIDQFNNFDHAPTPVITGTADIRSWQGKTKPKTPSAAGRYVGLF